MNILKAITMTVIFSTTGSVAQDGVAGSANDICPIKTGASLPPIILQSVEGKDFDLNAAAHQKPTILIVYRGGWCPYCNRQLSGINQIEPQIIAMGYQILAVSTDKPEKLVETIQKDELHYTLLSDSKMTASKLLGLAFRVDDKTLERYQKAGIDLEGASGEKHYLLPVPAVFVLNTDGVIQFEYVNPNYKVRLDPEILLAAAKSALKSSERKN